MIKCLDLFLITKCSNQLLPSCMPFVATRFRKIVAPPLLLVLFQIFWLWIADTIFVNGKHAVAFW